MYLRNSNSIGNLSCLILVLMLLIAEESKKSNQIDQKLHPKAHIIPRVKNNILMNEMCSTWISPAVIFIIPFLPSNMTSFSTRCLGLAQQSSSSAALSHVVSASSLSAVYAHFGSFARFLNFEKRVVSQLALFEPFFSQKFVFFYLFFTWSSSQLKPLRFLHCLFVVLFCLLLGALCCFWVHRMINAV